MTQTTFPSFTWAKPPQGHLLALFHQSKDSFMETLSNDEYFNQWRVATGLQTLPLELFIEAMTHRSFVHEARPALQFKSYERLEFLGDTLVQWIVSAELMKRYPDKLEGELSKLRGSMVNQEALSQLARSLDLSSWLLIGRGEESEAGAYKPSLLCDVFEALIAALSFVMPPEQVRQWFCQLTQKLEPDFFSQERLLDFDAKSTLQELTMSLYKEIPQYEAREESEDREFYVDVTLKGHILASGQGKFKKQLMKNLAKKILKEKSYLDLK
jgi:ribonuclease III